MIRTICGCAVIAMAAVAYGDAETPDSPSSPPNERYDIGTAKLLDDPEHRPPGALEPQLEIIRRDPANWLNIAPEDEWLNLIRDPFRSLDEAHGLAITGAYTMLFQQASGGPGDRNGASGDMDLFMKWTLLGRGTKDTGTFVFAAEHRHALGPNPPSELTDELGTLLGTTNGFNDRGEAIKEAYWVQRLFDDRVRVGLGRADPENLVGGHKLQSSNTSFLNKAFSTNPTIAFPGSGMAAAMSVRPVDWFYVGGGAANAYGNTTTSDIDRLFDEWDLFSFVEGGFTPKIEGLGEGRYRVAIWQVDSLDRTDRPSDSGFSIIVDQDFGESLSIFARYGYSDAEVVEVQHLIEAGGAWKGLIGSSEDLTGLAVAWAVPPDDRPEEKVVEVFHRMQLTGRMQLTFGAQLIIDPSDAPDHDEIGVFSVRYRLGF